MPTSGSSSGPSTPAHDSLAKAVGGLKAYTAGSSRGALAPIDGAVLAAISDPISSKDLEHNLLDVLRKPPSAAAVEYICSKLKLIGSELSVPALASLLTDPQLSQAACDALQTMPCTEAGNALRKAVSKLNGLDAVTAINCLAARREEKSTRVLASLIRRTDSAVIEAALGALGEVGSARSAQMLRAFEAKTPAELRGPFADAVLTCAERLSLAGQLSDAEKLYELLLTEGYPELIRQAAKRGLDKCAASKSVS